MEKILCALMTMVLLASCSTNEVKQNVAEQIGSISKPIIEKELVKTCDPYQAAAEAQLLSGKLQTEIEKVLKVKKTNKKSLVGDIAQMGCMAILNKILPNLLEKNYDEYKCAMKAFHSRANDLSEKLCSKINI